MSSWGREVFLKIDNFYESLNFSAHLNRSESIARILKSVPIITEVYGIGFPYYGQVDPRHRICLSLEDYKPAPEREKEFLMHLMPDFDFLLVFTFAERGPWVIHAENDYLDPRMMESFIHRISLYHRQWKESLIKLDQEGIADRDADLLEEFSKHDKLHIDFVPVPDHIWKIMPCFVEIMDFKIFRFIRDLMLTGEPLADSSSRIPVAFRKNFILNLLARWGPKTQKELLDIIFKIQPHAFIFEVYPQARDVVGKRWLAALNMTIREKKIIEANDVYQLTESGEKSLDEILAVRRKIFDKGFEEVATTPQIF